MKPRTILVSALLAFVAVSVLYLALRERRGDAPVETRDTALAEEQRGNAEPGGLALSDGIIVYYFHATRRCARCRLFEEYGHEAVVTGFPNEVSDRSIAWRMVNVDEPAHEHFVRDYSLTTKSIVLVEVRGGKELRWKNLPRIWDLVGDKTIFISYVQGEISDFRKGR